MSKPVVISVSGSHGGAGKTCLVERLLPCLPNCAAVKARTGKGAELSVLVEDDPAQAAGKDTGRYLAAGARRAYLIGGPGDEVRAAVREIIEGGEFDAVIVESNAMARELESDLAFFVRGAGEPKPGADVCEERADICVCDISKPRREH